MIHRRRGVLEGGVDPGLNVCMNATSADTSAGLKFLPYAGMLPPPWNTCRIISVAGETSGHDIQRGPASRPPFPPKA